MVRGVDWFYLAQDKGQMAGSCKHCNGKFEFIKCKEFLNELRNYWLLENDSIPWK
jgi:hypothetical protein